MDAPIIGLLLLALVVLCRYCYYLSARITALEGDNARLNGVLKALMPDQGVVIVMTEASSDAHAEELQSQNPLVVSMDGDTAPDEGEEYFYTAVFNPRKPCRN